MVDPFDLQPEDVDLDVIVHNLMYENRFGGNVGNWSVAQHSLCVHDLSWNLHGDWELAREALAHDFAEAWLKDIPSPSKERPEMAGYREAEQRAEAVIGRELSVTFGNPYVKRLDRICGYLEAENLLPGGPSEEWDPSDLHINSNTRRIFDKVFQKAKYGRVKGDRGYVYTEPWQERWEDLCRQYFGGEL